MALYKNITSKTTTVVKATAPGVLVRIVINKVGSLDTITIYDGVDTSGRVVGTISAPAIGYLDYDVVMNAGITIVTGGTTAGDYTVVYR